MELVPAAIAGILDETAKRGAMSETVVSALLHVVLVHLFRAQEDGALVKPVPGAGNDALAAKFVRLVEARIRSHWRVARNAAALGISRDRLGDICQRAHGRPPGTLIRARLLLEARRYLEKTELSVDQIAGLLGYSSASRFNRFFKAQEGQPPGGIEPTIATPAPVPNRLRTMPGRERRLAGGAVGA